MKKYYKNIFNKTEQEYYIQLKRWLLKEEKKIIIPTSCKLFNLSTEDKEISKLLVDKKVSLLPDDLVIMEYGKKINYKMIERITILDVTSKILEYANELKKRLYIFGSTTKVITTLEQLITDKYPNIVLVGIEDSLTMDKEDIISQMVQCKPDIVLVSLDIPVQEKFIFNNIRKFKKGIFLATGSSLNSLVGQKKRIPKVVRIFGLKYLYELIKDHDNRKNKKLFIRQTKKEK